MTMPRKPRDEIVVFGLAELLGDAHRALPPRRNWQATAVLHPLQPRHDQNRVCPSTGKGMDDHRDLPWAISVPGTVKRVV